MVNSNIQSATLEKECILQEIRDAVAIINVKIERIQESIGNKKESASKTTPVSMNDVVINKGVVLRLLQVSQATLARWRYKGLLKFETKSTRENVYYYHDLMDALRSGRIASRDFDPYAAIKRLTQWYNDNIQNDCTHD